MAKKSSNGARSNISPRTGKPRRKPPPHAWRPGQSGNPKGRPPRGSTLADAMREVLGEMPPQDQVPDNERGKTFKALFVRSVVRRAINGEGWAAKLVMDHIDGLPLQRIDANVRGAYDMTELADFLEVDDV